MLAKMASADATLTWAKVVATVMLVAVLLHHSQVTGFSDPGRNDPQEPPAAEASVSPTELTLQHGWNLPDLVAPCF